MGFFLNQSVSAGGYRRGQAGLENIEYGIREHVTHECHQMSERNEPRLAGRQARAARKRAGQPSRQLTGLGWRAAHLSEL